MMEWYVDLANDDNMGTKPPQGTNSPPPKKKNKNNKHVPSHGAPNTIEMKSGAGLWLCGGRWK